MSDKQIARIEAYLLAIMKHLKIDTSSVEVKRSVAQAPRPLSEADQQAIANAPKPTPPPGVVDVAPRVTATNAPKVDSSVPKADAKKE